VGWNEAGRRNAGQEGATREGGWCQEGATMAMAARRAGRSDDGTQLPGHTAQWEDFNPRAAQQQHKTKARQLCSRVSFLTTALEKRKEFECQEGLYQVDQQDSSASDGPLQLSDNRGFAYGNHIWSDLERVLIFFTRRSQEGTKSSRSVGRLECGAAKSRSHRLLAALLWQLAGSRWPELLRDRSRSRAQAGDAMGEQRGLPRDRAAIEVGVAALQIRGSLELGHSGRDPRAAATCALTLTLFRTPAHTRPLAAIRFVRSPIRPPTSRLLVCTYLSVQSREPRMENT
jgi:hypothetical protein